MDDIDRYYEILGLKPGASQERIKEAFRDLVKVWHPDRFSHDPKLQKKAQERLKEINLAYQQLEEFLQDHRVHPSQPPPRPETKQEHQFQQRPHPAPPRSTEQKRKQFAFQVNAVLMKFESGLRAVLLIGGYKLPPLTVEGRMKALLLVLGAIYFLAFGIYYLVTR